MFRRQKSIVGLDLGSQVFKAIELSLEGSEPVVTGFARVEIPSGGDRSAALAELLTQGRFRSRAVVTAVSGQSVVVRYLSMVEMSDSELRQAISYELDKYLPFDRDEVVLDCQRLKRRPTANAENASKGQISVVLAACRNAVVEQQLTEVNQHGLQPVAVDVDVFALGNAWELANQMAGAPDTERSIALVDVGASRTQINVMAGGETCFSREIGIGGADMTQAVARRMGLEVAEAEMLKRNPEERMEEVARAITPVLEDLVSEISLSLDFVENREGLGVEEVLLSGSAVLAPGAVEFLGQGTGRGARTWNPISGLRVQGDRVSLEELEKYAPAMAVAIGLASRIRAR